jgi:DNA-binding SARP family transcriptional activator
VHAVRSGPIPDAATLPTWDDRTGTLDYEVLGPVRALDGVREVPLGPAKQRAVLAVLLFAEGRTVPRQEIIAGVWGPAATAGAPGLVATYVARLRKILEPARVSRSGQGTLTSQAGGYRLEAGRAHVDLWQFQDAVSRAWMLRSAGETVASLAVLEEALGLWRGAGLDGVPGPFAEAQRDWLGDVRLVAVEERFDTLLDLGRHAEAAPQLANLARVHPHRERIRALLMLALYRTGRQADALALFAETRRMLVRDVGVEPGPEMRELQERMLRQDPALMRRDWRD